MARRSSPGGDGRRAGTILNLLYPAHLAAPLSRSGWTSASLAMLAPISLDWKGALVFCHYSFGYDSHAMYVLTYEAMATTHYAGIHGLISHRPNTFP